MEPSESMKEPCASALLYAVGALPEPEEHAFAAHLAACPACQGELARQGPVIAALFAAVPPVTPQAATRAELDQSIGHGPAGPLKSSPLRGNVDQAVSAVSAQALWIQRSAEASWEKSAIDGVSIRVLFSDPANNHFTALVRMAPGTSYPSHRHGGTEECLVLEGDLHVGDAVMGPGDYQRAPEGSRHGPQATTSGCLLYITSSLSDVFE